MQLLITNLTTKHKMGAYYVNFKKQVSWHTLKLKSF